MTPLPQASLFLMSDDLRIDAPPYRGLLSVDLLARGMNAANANAARLLADAELLWSSGRHSSAAALAMMAIEELAKEDILKALATWPSEARVFWKSFASHPDKGDLGRSAFIADDASALDVLVQTATVPLGMFGRRMEFAKWRAIYVDCLVVDGGPLWWSPADFSEDEARKSVEMARRVVNTRVVSVEEVEALIRHVGPVAGATWGEINRAQGQYLREVVDRGLRPMEPWMRVRLGFDPWAEEPKAPPPSEDAASGPGTSG